MPSCLAVVFFQDVANEARAGQADGFAIAAGIALVIITAVQLVGTNLNTTFGNVAKGVAGEKVTP